MDKKILLFFILIAAVSAYLLSLASPEIFPFTPDSVYYLESARNIKTGNGYCYTTANIEPFDKDILQSMYQWPPGYSILIAGLSLLGINEPAAALLIPSIAFLLLPLAFFILFRFITDKMKSFWIAVIIPFSMPCFILALMVMSDMLFLLIVLVSFIILFKAIKENSPFWSFAAGVFSGLALVTRNAGYALFISVILSLILSSIYKLLSTKNSLKIASGYTAGFIATYAPLLFHNIAMFGLTQPFSVPASKSSFAKNTLVYAKAFNLTVLGNENYLIIFCVISSIILTLVAIHTLKDKTLIKLKDCSPKKLIYIICLISYALFGSLLIIAALTKYQLGEPAYARYTLQYSWIYIFFFSIATLFLIKKISRRYHINPLYPIGGLIIIYLFLQLTATINIITEHKQESAEIKYLNLDAAVSIINNLPKDTYIISNNSALLRSLTDKKIRSLEKIHITNLIKVFPKTRNIAIVLIKKRGVFYDKKTGLPPLPEGSKYLMANGKIVIIFRRSTL